MNRELYLHAVCRVGPRVGLSARAIDALTEVYQGVVGATIMTDSTHDRFQVCCDGCGFIAASPNIADAFARASSEAGPHSACRGNLTVFDAMARRGTPHIWRWTGEVLRVKSYQEVTM